MNNPERQLKRLYGITLDDKNQLLILQENKCPVCKEPFSDLSSAHVDHCHKTGKVRGLLHGNCNTLLGMAKDNPEILFNSILYLLAFLNASPLSSLQSSGEAA